MDIATEKNNIRVLYKARRKSLAADIILSQSQLICQNFINNILPSVTPDIKDPIFSIYLSANNEVDTTYLINHFIKNKIDFSIPKIDKNKKDLKYILYNKDLNYIKNEEFKSLTEPHSGKEVVPDILIIPLVAFDKNKTRIGMAKGFFDRSITKLKTKKSKIVTIGLAYSIQQYSQDIPCEEHDQSLDYIVSSDFIIS